MAAEKIDALELDIISNCSTDKIDKLISALGRLSTALSKVKSKSITVSMNTMSTASYGAAKSLVGFGARLTAVIALFKKLADVISDSVANAATYIKSLNMFTISLGKYADNATRYAETIRGALGIDISGWQKTQGVFETLINGAGIAGDKAAYMSQNLTQLAYDISSFYGITVDEAANKLKSAMAGRTQPVRNLGYTVDQAELTDIAKNPANYGKQTFYINQQTGAIEANTAATEKNTNHKIVNFNQLKQEEKYQLRYIALMQQNTQVQGDYARALNDPYNQLDIFKQQLNVTSRSLGNMFIPALNKVLPYLSAFAQLASEAFQAIAQFLGFELPDMKERIGDKKITKPYNDVVKATGKAAKNAKKMKDYMLGIDELNVFNPNDGATGGGAGKKGKNSNLKNLKLPGYDFLGKAVENGIKKAKDTIKKLFNDWKQHPFMLPVEIVVTGMSELGEKIWEKLLGMTPEQLAKQALEHGNSVGVEFSNQFKQSIGNKGADFWEWVLGKTPEQLRKDAERHGFSIFDEFISQLSDKLTGQDVLDKLLGSPADLARRAADAGNTVGEQFGLETQRALLLAFFDNPTMRKVFEWLTHEDLDTKLYALDEKIKKKNKQTEKAPSYVSAEQAKNLTDKRFPVSGQKKQTLNKSMTLQNAKFEAKNFVNGYTGELAAQANNVENASLKYVYKPTLNGFTNYAQLKADAEKTAKETVKSYTKTIDESKEDVWKNANNSMYKSTVNGMTNNGTANSKYKSAAVSGMGKFINNVGTSAQKRQAQANASSVGESASKGVKEWIDDFRTTGENSTKGYIKGILAYVKETGTAGAAIGAAALKALEKKLDTGSPSKEFAKLGKYSALGFANGVTENTKYATSAVANMAKDALDVFGNASDLSNKIILNGSVADPFAGGRVSLPVNNSGYGVGAANEGAMASLASSVYQAIVSGIASANANNDDKDVKVIIDGKEVFKVVQTESRKRGVAISNGTFSR